MNLSLDPDLMAAMRKYCEEQDVAVPIGRAVDVAIREFLVKRGAGPEDMMSKK